MNAQWVRCFLGCTCLCLPCVSSGSTSIDICQEPASESHLTIAYYDQEAALLEGNVGETNVEMYGTDVLIRPNGRWTFGIGHRSTVLHAERIELQTNGYLHTFFFPVHRLSRSADKGFRLSVAPALSASSNVVTDIDEYSTDAMQLLAAAVWNRRISNRADLHYGICGDHRFGKYRVYPVITSTWRVHPDWTIELGFPASQLTHQLSKRLTTLLRVTPNGNAWFVKDKSLTKQSSLVYESYLLEWALDWRAGKNLSITANVGRDFRRRFEMTLLDETRVRLSADNATRIGVNLGWYF